MVFAQILTLMLLAWSLGAIQLIDRARGLHATALWLAGGWALAVVAVIGTGGYGLLRDGHWQALSTGQALHAIFGEGSLALRRSEWGALNRAVGVYLNLDIAWTLLALCLAQFHGFVFRAGAAERRRRQRLRPRSR
ncbi:hypothetical protein [Luteimonas sp. 100069]|uniref:hypothetical protein n=1 Tax=Luteimonas sp. 100069 TaxID=2006109 RepID=UPI000F4E65AB|nr:hypothetical protein [Luteimonas sp. 100069]RPD87709.1 hypothetical protein EGK76_00415 [Luteimonas sp. 100069]